MKKSILTFIMLAGVGVFAGENLLKNPSFEESAQIKYEATDEYRAERLAGWSVQDWGGSPKDGSKRGKVGLKTHSDASDGKASGHLYTTGEKRKNLLISQSMRLTPGKKQKYLLTFKFKKADQTPPKKVTVFASYQTYKKNKETKKTKRLAYESSKPTVATGKWQSIEFSFTVSDDAESLVVLLRANNNAGIIFDEVLLKTVD